MELQKNQSQCSKNNLDMNVERIEEENYDSRKTNHSAMVIEHTIHDKFDRENAKNPQLVTHVSKHIFNYLKDIEVNIPSFFWVRLFSDVGHCPILRPPRCPLDSLVAFNLKLAARKIERYSGLQIFC